MSELYKNNAGQSLIGIKREDTYGVTTTDSINWLPIHYVKDGGFEWNVTNNKENINISNCSNFLDENGQVDGLKDITFSINEIQIPKECLTAILFHFFPNYTYETGVHVLKAETTDNKYFDTSFTMSVNQCFPSTQIILNGCIFETLELNLVALTISATGIAKDYDKNNTPLTITDFELPTGSENLNNFSSINRGIIQLKTGEIWNTVNFSEMTLSHTKVLTQDERVRTGGKLNRVVVDSVESNGSLTTLSIIDSEAEHYSQMILNKNNTVGESLNIRCLLQSSVENGDSFIEFNILTNDETENRIAGGWTISADYDVVKSTNGLLINIEDNYGDMSDFFYKIII